MREAEGRGALGGDSVEYMGTRQGGEGRHNPTPCTVVVLVLAGGRFLALSVISISLY